MVYGYLRSDEESSIVVILNNDTKSHKISISLKKSYLVDLLTGKEYYVDGDDFEFNLKPMTGMILK